MSKNSRRCYFSAMIGNILEHYDAALYSFAAPFIAPFFLGPRDRLSSLILIYAIPIFGFAARPLGSLVFGRIGDHKGRKHALFYSMIGLSIATVAIGCLPSYQQIGNTAFIGLAIIRILQNFFLAGETAGGAVFALEHTPLRHRSLISSFYSVSTIFGILIASGACLLFTKWGIMENYWRLLFYFGAIAAIAGFIIRQKTAESDEFLSRNSLPTRSSFIKPILTHIPIVLSIAFAYGFSYVTYSFAFVFMHAYTPLVTSITQSSALEMNTALLFLDMALIPLFGYLAMKIGKEKVMLIGTLTLACIGAPLFFFLQGASLFTVIVIRLTIVVFGVAFTAPYYAWAVERILPEHRFTLLSFSHALAYHFGHPTTTICLWLYKKSHLTIIPGIYLSISAALAAAIVFCLSYRTRVSVQARAGA